MNKVYEFARSKNIDTIQIEVINYRTDLFNEKDGSGYYGKRGYFKVDEVGIGKVNLLPH